MEGGDGSGRIYFDPELSIGTGSTTLFIGEIDRLYYLMPEINQHLHQMTQNEEEMNQLAQKLSSFSL